MITRGPWTRHESNDQITLNESTIGSATIARLLPFIDHVDMDGPLLLEEDVATGIDYDFGKIICPGTGFGD